MTNATGSKMCMRAVGAEVTAAVGPALTAHVGGVKRCGSPWSCPICAPVIRQGRAVEIDAGIRRHLDGGGGVEFLTLTLRHHRHDSLASRLDVISRALGLCLQSGSWEQRRARLGYVGAIRSVEITWGERNGWHPHAHALLLFSRPLTNEERADLSAYLYGRWSNVARKRSLGEVTEAHGVDLRPVGTAGALGEYLTTIDSDWSPGLELARTDIKRHAPFDLLRALDETGETRWALLWMEYERATFGKRSLVWSPGLRARLLPDDVERTDVELAASDGGDLVLVVARIDADHWHRTLAAGTTGDLLSSIECVAGSLFWICDRMGHELRPPPERVKGAQRRSEPLTRGLVPVSAS